MCIQTPPLHVSTFVELNGTLYGAKPDHTGPIGGGADYPGIVTTGDFLVAGVEELLTALEQARAGQVIFIRGDARLDLTEWVYTDKQVLRVPAGVTLASDRGHRGSPGAMLCSDALQTIPLIEIAGPQVRITGLQLRGPDPHRRLAFHHRVFHQESGSNEQRSDRYYKLPNSIAINTMQPALEVDNCRISGWSHSGVQLRGGTQHRVHHCHIHHCQRMGLGYGVSLDQAQAEIAYNLMQDNKHHLAGTGALPCAYEAHHNVVLAPTESHALHVTGENYGQDHTFDMHGGEDRLDGTDIAGTWVKIHHNTVLPPYVAVYLRGQPQESAEIHHNWFCRHTPGKTTIRGRGNMIVHDNLYGSDDSMVCA